MQSAQADTDSFPPSGTGAIGAEDAPLLEMSGISKRFGAVTALKDVDFELHERETPALLGDTGAGKSTLVKIISGYYRADQGEFRLGGKPVSFADPHQARAAGIETIYQALALFDNLDAAANIFVGRAVMWGGVC